MGKIKERLIEDMMKHPELYNGEADYEFWIQCHKKKLFKKKKIDSKSHKQKGK
jgi:hypothetical protein